MRHLLSGVALAALIACGAPAWARSQATPEAGAAIIPPADPTAAKPAASPPSTEAAPAAAVVAATAIRHDRAPHRRYVWHRRHARRHHWGHLGGDRVAEALNFVELHRIMPPHPMPPHPMPPPARR
jgi:hypothetical protein